MKPMRSALLIVPLMLVACGNEEEIKKKVAAVQQQADDQASKAKQAAQHQFHTISRLKIFLHSSGGDASPDRYGGRASLR